MTDGLRQRVLMVGLTGSIGMGKTETAHLFAKKGIAVFDADQAVHELYATGGRAVPLIAEKFPDAVRDGAVDRTVLSGIVLHDPSRIKTLESIVHPLVRKQQLEFVQASVTRGDWIIVFDIPLLFETRDPGEFDHIVVTTAPQEIQRERVLERPGMTEQKLDAVLARQTPDAEKRAKADFIIETHRGLDDASRQVDAVIAALRERSTTNPASQ